MTNVRTAGFMLAAALLTGGVFLYYAFGAFLPWHEEHEADRVADLAGIRAGTVVAEIGAGQGRFSMAFARRVGPSGRVYATELSAAAVAALAARAELEKLRHVIPTHGDRMNTNLPDGCCDVVFLRNVYHHVTDPSALGRGLRRAVRDGGRLVVADFEPGAIWFHGGRPPNASERRTGHGVARGVSVAELTAAGFQVEQEFARWSGPMWLVVFRASPASP